MADGFVSATIKRAKPDWYYSIRRYERSHLWKGIWQLLNTFIPYFLVCILMYVSIMAGYSYLVILCLAVVAAGLLVRIFIFSHEVWTLTTNEFNAASKLKRFWYRISLKEFAGSVMTNGIR
jgi:fatty acid desaturase